MYSLKTVTNNTKEPEISPFITHICLLFQNPTEQLSNITGGDSCSYKQHSLEPQKAFSTYAVSHPNTCKHILMCEIGGITL